MPMFIDETGRGYFSKEKKGEDHRELTPKKIVKEEIKITDTDEDQPITKVILKKKKKKKIINSEG